MILLGTGSEPQGAFVNLGIHRCSWYCRGEVHCDHYLAELGTPPPPSGLRTWSHPNDLHSEYSLRAFCDRGGEPQQATSQCIGRLDLERRQPDGSVPGLGCDWTTFGVIQLDGTLRVQTPDGSLVRAMPFASVPAPAVRA